jgi:acetolactate synthase I/II/III large subunit
MVDRYAGAEAFIDVLNANGVENIFFNPGGEQATIQATISRYRIAGKRAPRLILCLDEAVAMTAAHGHYMISGKPQLVMVHAELGTLQVGGALHNAQWGRVPVILWAGAFPDAQRLNWKKEPYDQGIAVRNCVKWDHKIGADENMPDVLQQAFKLAFSEPRGPVYLNYPREILRGKINDGKAKLIDIPRIGPAGTAALDKVADALIKAKKPLIVAGYTGRYPESVATLVELAETLCAPVLTGPTRMNFPTTHPLCAGIEQILGSRKANPYLPEADVILVIDYDVPYAIAEGIPAPGANLIQIDVEPLTVGRPLWGRNATTYIEADSRQAIPALDKIIKQKLTPAKKAEFRERFARLEAAHLKQREAWLKLGKSSSKKKRISPDWLCYCVNQVIDEDTILVNHTITHSASPTEQIPRTKAGTLLSCAGGSISWAPGAALGAKIAAPDKTVVSLMTDGGFVWGSPVATLWTASTYKAPFLSVVFNNKSYEYMRGLIHRTSGETKYSKEMAFEAGVDIPSPPDYAAIAKDCGGYGLTVEDPADVLPALKKAMVQVRRGRPAVVDVILD